MLAKNLIFMTEDNVPAGKLKQNEKNNFFASLKWLKKGVGSGAGSLRTKMSRIPNTLVEREKNYPKMFMDLENTSL